MAPSLPGCRTFSLPDGSWIQGPRQVRSEEEPWGFEDLTRGDAIAVRQGNLYMKKALKSLAERHVAGGIASLEHPHNSYMWYTEEVEEKLASGDWYLTCYSHCCFGGQRVKCTNLLHNSSYLCQALHRPDCPGHVNLKGHSIS